MILYKINKKWHTETKEFDDTEVIYFENMIKAQECLIELSKQEQSGIIDSYKADYISNDIGRMKISSLIDYMSFETFAKIIRHYINK